VKLGSLVFQLNDTAFHKATATSL